MEDNIANNKKISNSLNNLVWDIYLVHMARNSLYRMRTKAIVEIYGGHDVSYSYVHKYCNVVKMTNLGSAAFYAHIPVEHPERQLVCTILISFTVMLNRLVDG